MNTKFFKIIINKFYSISFDFNKDISTCFFIPLTSDRFPSSVLDVSVWCKVVWCFYHTLNLFTPFITQSWPYFQYLEWFLLVPQFCWFLHLVLPDYGWGCIIEPKNVLIKDTCNFVFYKSTCYIKRICWRNLWRIPIKLFNCNQSDIIVLDKSGVLVHHMPW